MEAKLRLDRVGRCSPDEVLVNDKRVKKGWYCRKNNNSIGMPTEQITQPSNPPEKKKNNTGWVVGAGLAGTALVGGALLLGGNKGGGDTPPKTKIKEDPNKEKEIQQKASELAEKESLLAQQSQKNKQWEDELNQRSQELEKSQSALDEISKGHQETENELKTRSQQLDNREKLLNDKSTDLDQREEVIAQKEQAIAEKEREPSQEELDRLAKEAKIIDEQKEKDLRDRPLSESEKVQFLDDIRNPNHKDHRRFLTISPQIWEDRIVNKTAANQLIKEYGLDEPEVAALLSYTEYGYVGANELLRGNIKKDTPVGELSSLLTRQFNESLKKLPLFHETKEYEQNKNLHDIYDRDKPEKTIFYPVQRSSRYPESEIKSWDEGTEITLAGFLSTSQKGIASGQAGKQYRQKSVVNEGSEELAETNPYVRKKTKTGKRDEIIRALGIKEDPKEKPVVFNISEIKTGRFIPSYLSSTPSDNGEVVFPTNTPFRVISKTWNKEGKFWEINLSELDYNFQAVKHAQTKSDSASAFIDTSELIYGDQEALEWRLTYPVKIIVTWQPSWSI